MIKVTIKVHEHYAQTVVRLYGRNGTTHVEFATCGADLPKWLFAAPTNHDFSERVWDMWERDNPAESLAGFTGYFEMQLEGVSETPSPMGYDVTNARYVTEAKGGRDVTKAYQHPLLGERMRQNLFDVLAAKDVAKLNEILGAVADAWG